MKSTAIFLGVNVAASVPLVLCPQANAQGEAQLSGTADFLKNSLAKASDTATAKPMLAGDPTFSATRRTVRIQRDIAPTQALSSPHAIATRQAMAPIGGVKLRPFMPGRKLPSRADLESNLSAMTPQFDTTGQAGALSNLSAGVSESNYLAPASNEYQSSGYGNYRPSDARSQNRARLKDAARVASGYDRRSASRSLPGQSPATPGQVGFPCAQQAVAHMNPVRSGAPRNAEEWAAQMDAQAQGAAEVPVQNRQMATAPLGETAAPANTAGPAPFPLNLLPEASLKQFIGSTAAGGKRAASVAAPSYFGSWKGNSQIAQGGAGGGSKAGLQPSGFHTYLSGAKTQTGSQMHTQTASAFHAYAPMAMTNRRGAPGAVAEAKHIAQNVHPSATVQVATYGAYQSKVTF
ncbi:MAG: hypothetical protein KGS72_22075 [Cyanobacteria bacterium REEB67]|nr:hypothetical protein [Cyanobacteria bacterium REEB67]